MKQKEKDKTGSENLLVQIGCNPKNDDQQNDVDTKVSTRSQLENNQSLSNKAQE